MKYGILSLMAAALFIGAAMGATPLDAILSLNDTTHDLVDLRNANDAAFNQSGFENVLGPLGGLNDSNGADNADLDWRASITEWGNTTL